MTGEAHAAAPFIDPKLTVPIEGEPTRHPRYIQNAVQAVGIVSWGGPFRLDPEVDAGTSAGSVYLDRHATFLDEDPLAGSNLALNVVFRTPDAASRILAKMKKHGAYTFYVGPGGYFYPTLISDTTAPALCSALRKALERERVHATAARDTSIELLAWFIGARSPIQLRRSAATGLEAFTRTEQAIILEARRLVTSPAFTRLRAAHTAKKGLSIRFGGRLIQYEPDAPVSGMTLFGENGFLLGREAFTTEAELIKTVLHELHRLSMSTVQVEGATMALVRSETQAAQAFAERALKATLEGSGR